MTRRQGYGWGCLLLACMFSVIAVKNTFGTPIVPIDDPSGLGVSRAVGAFLPAVATLIAAIWLLQKPKP